jgi:hypothetical protein
MGAVAGLACGDVIEQFTREAMIPSGRNGTKRGFDLVARALCITMKGNAK